MARAGGCPLRRSACPDLALSRRSAELWRSHAHRAGGGLRRWQLAGSCEERQSRRDAVWIEEGPPARGHHDSATPPFRDTCGRCLRLRSATAAGLAGGRESHVSARLSCGRSSRAGRKCPTMGQARDCRPPPKRALRRDLRGRLPARSACRHPPPWETQGPSGTVSCCARAPANRFPTRLPVAQRPNPVFSSTRFA